MGMPSGRKKSDRGKEWQSKMREGKVYGGRDD